jgi:hypothetical protein
MATSLCAQMTDIIQHAPSHWETPPRPPADSPGRQTNRPSRAQFGIALAIAAVSDALAFWLEIILPLQIALDIVTAFVLYRILGRRWGLLPGLIAEAIPGMGIFPVWILVVASVYVYDDIKARKR